MSESTNNLRVGGAPQGWTLAFAGMVPVLVVITLTPALPKMMTFFAKTPYADLLVPLIVTIPGLAAAFLSPAVGLAVDKYGKRKPLLISMFVFAILAMLPALLNNLFAIVATRLVTGIALSFVMVITTAMYADYFPAERQRTWLTVLGVTLPPTAAVGFVVAGALAGQDWHYAFLLYAFILPVWFLAYLFCYEPPAQTRAIDPGLPSTPFPWGPVAWVSAGAIIIGIFFYAYVIFAGLALAQLGVTNATELGAIIGAVSLATIVGALMFNLLSRRAPAELIVAVQLILMGAGFFGMGLSTTLPMMVASSVVQQIGAGMMVATVIFWMSGVVPAEHRGAGFGILNTVSYIGQVLTPLIVTGLQRAGGGLLQAFVWLGVIAIVCGIFFALVRAIRRWPSQSAAILTVDSPSTSVFGGGATLDQSEEPAGRMPKL